MKTTLNRNCYCQ